MKDCFECEDEFDPAKDFFIVINERKGPSRDFCSMGCAQRYMEDA